MSDTPPDLASLARRVARLEAEGAIRLVVATYFRLCDTLGPDTDWAAMEALFTRDAVWAGRGRYARAFGRHEGRSAIMGMLRAYADPPHFVLNAHYLASEIITVHEGPGSGASASWMMLQVSTYRDGRSDLRSAAISIEMAREDGVWRIAAFTTDNIFSRDVGPWNDEAPISVPEPTTEE
ncbi:nuclear transport factor 2 family protein, partial [Novosphingobium rosa]|uniref:nuclear transport factor 2 family protein n=1 Tax=Novosphingobium rosa TaxID=76978 RepID=UPI0008343670